MPFWMGHPSCTLNLVLDFWWHLLGFKTRAGSLIWSWWRHMWCMFPKIHPWCDNCQSLDSQHGSKSLSPHTYISAEVGCGIRSEDFMGIMFSMFNICVCTHTCMHVCICTCVGEFPHQPTPPPNQPPLRWGQCQLTKNAINLELIKIIQFCLKICKLWIFYHLWVSAWVGGCMGGWLSWWVG